MLYELSLRSQDFEFMKLQWALYFMAGNPLNLCEF